MLVGGIIVLVIGGMFVFDGIKMRIKFAESGPLVGKEITRHVRVAMAIGGAMVAVGIWMITR